MTLEPGEFERLEGICKRNCCAVCNGELGIQQKYVAGIGSTAWVQCKAHPEHSGYKRNPPRSQPPYQVAWGSRRDER